MRLNELTTDKLTTPMRTCTYESKSEEDETDATQNNPTLKTIYAKAVFLNHKPEERISKCDCHSSFHTTTREDHKTFHGDERKD